MASPCNGIVIPPGFVYIHLDRHNMTLYPSTKILCSKQCSRKPMSTRASWRDRDSIRDNFHHVIWSGHCPNKTEWCRREAGLLRQSTLIGRQEVFRLSCLPSAGLELGQTRQPTYFFSSPSPVLILLPFELLFSHHFTLDSPTGISSPQPSRPVSVLSSTSQSMSPQSDVRFATDQHS